MLADGGSLLSHYKRLIMIRRANPEIARGEYRALDFDGVKAGGFLCTWQGATVAVLHNPGRSAWKVDLARAEALQDMQIAAAAGAGGARIEDGVLILDGQTSAVLR